MPISTIKPLIAAPKDGKTGDDAVSFYMFSEQSSIHVDKNGNAVTSDFCQGNCRALTSSKASCFFLR